MPVKITKRAAARIHRMRRYAVSLTYTKTKGFYVKARHGTMARPHRVLHVTAGARAALGTRIARVVLRGKRLGVRIVKPRPKSLNERALALASSQLGVHELGGTNNVKFNTWYYGRPVSGPEYAWCAVFVSWTLSHVGHSFKFAYVPAIVQAARTGTPGLSVIPFSAVASTLAAGHPVLACYDWPGESPGVSDHVEFVERVLGASSFQAIGGNTGGPGADQSNGGQVWRNIRYSSTVQAFIKVTP